MGIIELLMALPKILGAIQSIIGALEKSLGPNWDEKLKNLNSAHDALEKAVTIEEKKEALKDYARARNDGAG